MAKHLEHSIHMRTSKSRSRGKGRNNNRSIGNVVNRVFESSGPEGKVRGTPQQIIDKYKQLHRDAQLSGDPVSAENFQQHAEHYTRLLGAALKEQEARREAHEAQQRDRQKGREEREQQRQQHQRAAVSDDDPVALESVEAKPDALQEENTSPADPGAGEQPEIMEFPDVIDPEVGLVETVERKPTKPRKPRGRKPKAPPKSDVEAAEDTA